MAEQRSELGKRIAEARRSKRWKQKELAAAVHVEPTTVSRWETGRHAPDLDVLEGIARATDKPIAFFLDANVVLADAQGESTVLAELRDHLDGQHDAVMGRLDAIEEQVRALATSPAGTAR